MAMAKKTIIKVCIGFLDCPRLNTDAATYLLLTQNTIQDQFEFSVVDLDAYTEQIKLEPVNVKQVVSDAEYAMRSKRAISVFDQHVKTEMSKYAKQVDKNAKWIIITEVGFVGDFFMSMVPGVVLLSVANWKRSMAPPSLLEFILRQSQSALMFQLNLDLNHSETKGCLGDFSDNLADAKQHVLIGYICSSCHRQIEKKHGKDSLEALKKLLDRSWIGSADDYTSIASIMKKTFAYDLYVTKGYTPTIFEKAKDVFLTGGTQEIVKTIGYIVLAYLLLKLGLKGTS